MSGEKLGRLERVRDLRAAWASEAGGFTPWLAREENLAALGEALGIGLVLEAQEQRVGPFRADILCKDGAGDWVLIENQLERTDHTHVGQLVTYASGLEAVTIVWIAGKFTDEHRATLDWLNRITDEKFRFFGVEVELWRIGDSPTAPQFRIVSKPESWSHGERRQVGGGGGVVSKPGSVSRPVARTERGELSPVQEMYLAYWTAFSEVLNEVGGPVRGDRKPQSHFSWMGYAIGRSHFRPTVAVIPTHRKIYVELYIDGGDAKPFFFLLREQRAEIERELGYALAWEEKPGKIISRVRYYWDGVDPYDREDWSRQHRWLAENLNAFYRVFHHRVRDLDAADWRGKESADDSAG